MSNNNRDMVFQAGSRFYFPIDLTEFDNMMVKFYTIVLDHVPKYISGTAPPREVFVIFCERVLRLYIHLQNYERHKTSTFLPPNNWYHADSPSKIKNLLSVPYPLELINMIREMCRPYRANGHLYFPYPNFWSAPINPDTNLLRNNLIAGPQIPGVAQPWQVNVQLVCLDWLRSSGVKFELWGLESLEAAGAYCLVANDTFLTREVEEKRIYALMMLMPSTFGAGTVEMGQPNMSWVGTNYQYPLVVNDLRSMSKPIFGRQIDLSDNVTIAPNWMMMLASNLEETHFPSLGATNETKRANFFSSGKRNNRKNRNRKGRGEQNPQPTGDPPPPENST